jgi:hypothetical protein
MTFEKEGTATHQISHLDGDFRQTRSSSRATTESNENKTALFQVMQEVRSNFNQSIRLQIYGM